MKVSCAQGQLELGLVVFLIWKLEVIKPSWGLSHLSRWVDGISEFVMSFYKCPRHHCCHLFFHHYLVFTCCNLACWLCTCLHFPSLETPLTLAYIWVNSNFNHSNKLIQWTYWSMDMTRVTSIWKSSPKTGKRPRLDQTKTGKDWTSSPGLWFLRIKYRKKTGLNWWICTPNLSLQNKPKITQNR